MSDTQQRPSSYEKIARSLSGGLSWMSVLAGDDVSPSGETYIEVVGAAAQCFEELAAELRKAEAGNTGALMCYPSPSELLSE